MSDRLLMIVASFLLVYGLAHRRLEMRARAICCRGQFGLDDAFRSESGGVSVYVGSSSSMRREREQGATKI